MSQNINISKQIGNLDAHRHSESLGNSDGGQITLPGSLIDIPEPWEVYTLKDAYKPRPPVVYIVDGLFPIPSLSIVFGAPACLKSFFLTDMVACVASGLNFLTPQPDSAGEISGIKTTKCPTLWLDFDNGTRTTHERFDAIGKAYGLPATTPLHYISMPNPGLDASSQKSMALLEDAISRARAKLVVIDNLGLISGKTEENSADMTAVMSNLRALSERFKIAIIVIHHERKSNGNNSRKGESLRGHSSIEASLDLVLRTERKERSNIVTVVSTKVRGPDVEPFSAKFVYENKDNLNELASARFFGMASKENSPSAEIRMEIKKAILATPDMNKSTLEKTVKKVLGGGVKVIRRHIEDLVASDEIQERPGPHNSKLFSMKQAE